MSRRNSNRRRRRNRGRFGPLFKLLCLLALVVALTVGATVFFRVEVVAVSGNVRYTEEEIIAATGIQVGENLFAMNKFKVSEELRRALPYIGEVQIRRSLPSTIVITVVEWDAMARVMPPTAAQALEAQQEMAGEPKEGEEPVLPAVAQEPWLISVKTKLLEPAPTDSNAIAVTGLVALMPQAGGMLSVPTSQQEKLSSLKELLTALNEAGLTEEVSSVALGSTQIELRYLDRYTVKLNMNADFSYALRVMRTVRENVEERHGPAATGTLDLTQERYEAIYLPG